MLLLRRNFGLDSCGRNRMSQNVYWSCSCWSLTWWLVKSASRWCRGRSHITLGRILVWRSWRKLEVVNYGEVVDYHTWLLLLRLLDTKRSPVQILISLLRFAENWSSSWAEGVLPIKQWVDGVAILRTSLVICRAMVSILKNQMRRGHILYSIRFNNALSWMCNRVRTDVLLLLLLLLHLLLLFASLHYQLFEVKFTILCRCRSLKLCLFDIRIYLLRWQYRRWNCYMRDRRRRIRNGKSYSWVVLN